MLCRYVCSWKGWELKIQDLCFPGVDQVETQVMEDLPPVQEAADLSLVAETHVAEMMGHEDANMPTKEDCISVPRVDLSDPQQKPTLGEQSESESSGVSSECSDDMDEGSQRADEDVNMGPGLGAPFPHGHAEGDSAEHLREAVS
jgi:hypothetical protein